MVSKRWLQIASLLKGQSRSAGCNSGERGGKNTRVMPGGTCTLSLLCQRPSSPAAGSVESEVRNERSCRRSGAAPCWAAVGDAELLRRFLERLLLALFVFALTVAFVFVFLLRL